MLFSEMGYLGRLIRISTVPQYLGFILTDDELIFVQAVIRDDLNRVQVEFSFQYCDVPVFQAPHPGDVPGVNPD